MLTQKLLVFLIQISLALCYLNTSEVELHDNATELLMNTTDIFKEIISNILRETVHVTLDPPAIHLINMNTTHMRFKRQSASGSKFSEAANMSNLKLLRTYLTVFRNLWAPSAVGAPHPMHPEVVKSFHKLFKESVSDFAFPPESKAP